jgi:hypothetical protein
MTRNYTKWPEIKLNLKKINEHHFFPLLNNDWMTFWESDTMGHPFSNPTSKSSSKRQWRTVCKFWRNSLERSYPSARGWLPDEWRARHGQDDEAYHGAVLELAQYQLRSKEIWSQGALLTMRYAWSVRCYADSAADEVREASWAPKKYQSQWLLSAEVSIIYLHYTKVSIPK